ncbi:glycosyltransferase family 2 protein [Candidatus Dojkabacteria bacterium]|nr:glycosyltransferase family 2 protein [Candidatus Dojkabacteria bacterium]
MKLIDIYKIADSKDSYTKEELFEVAFKTSSLIQESKFKDKIYRGKVSNKITLLFPIYNEEAFLDYSLESFFNSYAYPKTSYQVIFFLNSCTDNSFEKTIKILQKYKQVVKRTIDKKEYKMLSDPGLDITFFYSEDSNSYQIIRTMTKGRVNALKVATRMAKMNKSRAIISLDTDFVLDPLAIYSLSQEAMRHIVQKKDTIALTGSPIIVNNKKYTKVQKWLRNHFVWKDQVYNSLSGCSLVLEPNWLHKNIEDNIIEDYALGVKARYQGYKVLRVESARMWGYRTDYKDDLKQLSRSIKGRYQLLKKHPEFSDIILRDHFFIRPFFKRISYILNSLYKNPKLTSKWLWTFIFVEIAILRAKRDYKLKPNEIDWTPLDTGR